MVPLPVVYCRGLIISAILPQHYQLSGMFLTILASYCLAFTPVGSLETISEFKFSD